MSEVFDIILTCWNRPKFTEWSLQSIYQNTRTPHRVIVIDNGSERKMQQDLLGMKENGWIDNLVLLKENRGLEYAKHLGMGFVESRLFISTDNDILAYKYDPDWLEQLATLIDNNPEYAAIGCRPQILVGTGNIFEGRTEPVINFTHVPGYLRIMRTDFVNETGAWKDMRPLRGHEEYWISNKLAEYHMKVGWAKDIRCWHLFGSEDDWGYTGMSPESHGHTPVSSLPKDDKDEIYKGTGIFIQ